MLNTSGKFLLKTLLRLFLKRYRSIEASRKRDIFLTRLTGIYPASVSVEKFAIDGLPAAWISPETDSNTVILYFHGGGYVTGSLGTHQMLCADIAQTVNARLLFVEYRLAPEHPFPAALEDARTAYHWLLTQGVGAENIFLAGDSAGGGLSLALTLSLRDAKEPLPAGVICISPWTDLTMSGASHSENARAEVSLHPDSLRLWAISYAGKGDLKNPLISPYFAEYDGFPPTLIQVGEQEVLLDDARVVAEKAGSAGVDVTLSVFEGMWHVWHTLGTMLPEGRQAFEEIRRFILSQRAKRSNQTIIRRSPRPVTRGSR